MNHVFITGSNGQLGREMCNTFHYNGWHVHGADLHESCDHQSSQYLASYSKVNVSSREEVKTWFSSINSQIPRQYDSLKLALVNNAGLAVFSPSEDRTIDEIVSVCAVNLAGPIFTITEFKKCFHRIPADEQLIQLVVINIGSVYGLIAPNSSIYTDTARMSSEIYGASKAGLHQLTKYFATRYAASNFTINGVAPGGVLNSDIQGPEFIKNYSALVPKSRLCQDSEVSQLVYHLCDSNVGYLTGHTIPLDGGMTAW